MGEYFNQPIHNLPKGLTHLTLEKNFNKPINNLPESLLEIIIDGKIIDRKIIDRKIINNYNSEEQKKPKIVIVKKQVSKPNKKQVFESENSESSEEDLKPIKKVKPSSKTKSK